MHTTTRRTARRLLASAAITITATAGLAGAAQAAGHEPPSGELTGCPDGAVCLYPEDSWNWGNPSHVFFDQGTHRSEEHTSELQSRGHLVCRLLLEKTKAESQRRRR